MFSFRDGLKSVSEMDCHIHQREAFTENLCKVVTLNTTHLKNLMCIDTLSFPNITALQFLK